MTILATQRCVLQLEEAPKGHFRRMSRTESLITGARDKSDQEGEGGYARRFRSVGETTEGGDSLTRLYTPFRGRRIYIYIYIVYIVKIGFNNYDP